MSEVAGLSYRVIPKWEQLPAGYTHRDVAGVSVDSHDRVFMITRYDPRVIVYEKDGSFVRSWGEGAFTPRTHGITVGPDDMVYCVDDGDHTVRKFTPTGELLMTLGTSGVPSDTGYDGSNLDTVTHGGPPFHRCTNLAIAPNGELYVSDGYGNCRVHRFSADGRLIQSWGEPGTGPGQFYLPHGIWIDQSGRVMVADRENERIQIFTLDGEYISEWNDVQRPCAVVIGKDNLVYVAELSSAAGWKSYMKGLYVEPRPGRVSVFDLEGNLKARWGGNDVAADGNFVAPHGITVDSTGNVYVAEVTYTIAGRAGLVPEDCHDFQKFVPNASV